MQTLPSKLVSETLAENHRLRQMRYTVWPLVKRLCAVKGVDADTVPLEMAAATAMQVSDELLKK